MTILAWMKDKKMSVINSPSYEETSSISGHYLFDNNVDPNFIYPNVYSKLKSALWTRCDGCGCSVFIRFLTENAGICLSCSYHHIIGSDDRLQLLIDAGSWVPLNEHLSPLDPLKFVDVKSYSERLKTTQNSLGTQDAVQTGTAMIDGIPFAVGVMDFRFMGGSMGSVVGEKLTRLIEYATNQGLFLLITSTSGGARMQEGINSLMQMAKISSALHIYQNQANLFFISVCTSPTTGGVTASFAMLGDVIFSEPNTTIGFAGRRVVESILKQQLPETFQTGESLLEHGLLDALVPRKFLRNAITEVVRTLALSPKKTGFFKIAHESEWSWYKEESIRRLLNNNFNNEFEEIKSLYSSTLLIDQVAKFENNLSNDIMFYLDELLDIVEDTLTDNIELNNIKIEDSSINSLKEKNMIHQFFNLNESLSEEEGESKFFTLLFSL